jgi:hypothetical protein
MMKHREPSTTLQIKHHDSDLVEALIAVGTDSVVTTHVALIDRFVGDETFRSHNLRI